ncbi:MAG: hypothetical protein A3C79_02615 [Candidatus Taylorbacteria bacterium RIFCSPHIGHO2_02_FULL_45_28]|nr:MAG: hypothetical protein A3C79_02615 [Candidatus Taylorbacteria bacterium RIFCSPHIGHO2_02_FULL_45_28]
MVAAVLLFIISIAAAGGMYFWKSYLESSQVRYKEQLAQREKQFNPDLIEELKSQNVRIDMATRLIGNHVALSQIFDIIGRLTIENVRFLSMDVTTGTMEEGKETMVNMKGYGTSLSAVAWQSDVLGQLEKYGLRKVVKNPILSDPALENDGLVSFGFTATIDPASLSYEQSLIGPTDSANASTTP